MVSCVISVVLSAAFPSLYLVSRPFLSFPSQLSRIQLCWLSHYFFSFSFYLFLWSFSTRSLISGEYRLEGGGNRITIACFQAYIGIEVRWAPNCIQHHKLIMTGQHASMPTNAASNSASLRSRNSGSTTFNDAVKLEASRLSGDHCWLFETIEPD